MALSHGVVNDKALVCILVLGGMALACKSYMLQVGMDQDCRMILDGMAQDHGMVQDHDMAQDHGMV